MMDNVVPLAFILFCVTMILLQMKYQKISQKNQEQFNKDLLELAKKINRQVIGEEIHAYHMMMGSMTEPTDPCPDAK